MKEFFGILAFVAIAALCWVLWKIAGAAGAPSLDWVVGIAGFLWLLVIVTVPWNIHFQARDIVAEAAESEARGIAPDARKTAYARIWAQRSLGAAIALHCATAAGMWALAASGVSALGYGGAVAALLLTGARPIMRGYGYVRQRLALIRSEINYPREDVVALRATVAELVSKTDDLLRRLDAADASSWAAERERAEREAAETLDALRLAFDDERESNRLDHERIARDAQNAMAQVLGDAAIVSHVREIVRFFKQA